MCVMESLLGDYQSSAAETSTKRRFAVVGFFITGDRAAVSLKFKKGFFFFFLGQFFR